MVAQDTKASKSKDSIRCNNYFEHSKRHDLRVSNSAILECYII